MRKAAIVFCLLTLAARELSAQQPSPSVSPQPAPAANPAPAPGSATPSAGPTRNIKYEIFLTDSGGGAKPTTKNVTLIVVPGGIGVLRTSGKVADTPAVSLPRPTPRSGGAPEVVPPSVGFNVPLNVDIIKPTRFPDGSIRASIVVEYQPYVAGSKTQAGLIKVNVEALLQNGKRTVLSETADPTSDRRTTIEVTATVVE